MARDSDPRKRSVFQISARVAPETYHLLNALTAVLDENQARVLELALVALEKTLTPDDRKLVASLVKRRG